VETILIPEQQPTPSAPHAPPYRSHGQSSSTGDEDYDREQFNADLAFTFAFIWATALLRFVIVCRRHEPFTADPTFAALLTLGIPAVVFVATLVSALRGFRDAFRASSAIART
jgi:hypothetical protein